MLSSILSFLIAVSLAQCAILLQRSRVRSGQQLHDLLVELSRELSVPERLQLDELVGRRALLYANKRSLERQLSYALDDRTRKAYRTAVDQIERGIQALEARLPRVELLRRKMIVCNVLTVLCAATIALASWVYVTHKDAWS